MDNTYKVIISGEEEITLTHEECGISGTQWKLRIFSTNNLPSDCCYSTSLYFSSTALPTIRRLLEKVEKKMLENDILDPSLKEREYSTNDFAVEVG